MTDQLDGEYFARFIGLGGIPDNDHVKNALIRFMKSIIPPKTDSST